MDDKTSKKQLPKLNNLSETKKIVNDGRHNCADEIQLSFSRSNKYARNGKKLSIR